MRKLLRCIPAQWSNTPPLPSTIRPEALPSVADAAAELQPLPPSSAPPLDWSLKTGARLQSAQPFAAFEDAGLGSSSAACAALRRFADGCTAGGSLQVCALTCRV